MSKYPKDKYGGDLTYSATRHQLGWRRRCHDSIGQCSDCSSVDLAVWLVLLQLVDTGYGILYEIVYTARVALRSCGVLKADFLLLYDIMMVRNDNYRNREMVRCLQI